MTDRDLKPDNVTIATAGPDTVVECHACGDSFVWPTALLGDAAEAFRRRHNAPHTMSPSVATRGRGR